MALIISKKTIFMDRKAGNSINKQHLGKKKKDFFQVHLWILAEEGMSHQGDSVGLCVYAAWCHITMALSHQALGDLEKISRNRTLLIYNKLVLSKFSGLYVQKQQSHEPDKL